MAALLPFIWLYCQEVTTTIIIQLSFLSIRDLHGDLNVCEGLVGLAEEPRLHFSFYFITIKVQYS